MKQGKGFCRYIVGKSRKEVKEAFQYAGCRVNFIERWPEGYKVFFNCKSVMADRHEIYTQYPVHQVYWKLEERLGESIRPYIEWPR